MMFHECIPWPIIPSVAGNIFRRGYDPGWFRRRNRRNPRCFALPAQAVATKSRRLSSTYRLRYKAKSQHVIQLPLNFVNIHYSAKNNAFRKFFIFRQHGPGKLVNTFSKGSNIPKKLCQLVHHSPLFSVVGLACTTQNALTLSPVAIFVVAGKISLNYCKALYFFVKPPPVQRGLA